MTRARIACRAVLLDAGGVIVLPHRGLVGAALAELGIEVERSAVARAHYGAVRRLDRDSARGAGSLGYLPAFCAALGVTPPRRSGALAALAHLADRQRSGQILWSEPAPGARETIDALTEAGLAVVIVTNSDGHAAENLRDAGICQAGAGSGARVVAVIDSTLVGSAKPAADIFAAALLDAGADPSSAVHVGDTLSADVAGARAAGIAPVHLDPYRVCRDTDHRHIRSLPGIWRHIVPLPAAGRASPR